MTLRSQEVKNGEKCLVCTLSPDWMDFNHTRDKSLADPKEVH